MAVQNINSAPQTLRPGEHIPGARGLMGAEHVGVPGMPGNGAIPMAHFQNVNNRRDVPPPMQRPVMLGVVGEVHKWFDQYLKATRNGIGLREGENIPKVLILSWVMHNTKQPQRQDCLDCMKSEVFHISTSQPVVVRWENQPYYVVPYESRAFPLSVAYSILEMCRTNVFDSFNILWDERNNRYVSRMLSTGERIHVSPISFRDPTEDERKLMQNETGFVSPLMPVSMAQSDSGALLMTFGRQETPVKVGPEYTGPNRSVPGPHDRGTPPAGSAHPNEDATRPPFMTAPPGGAAVGGAPTPQVPTPGMPPSPPMA